MKSMVWGVSMALLLAVSAPAQAAKVYILTDGLVRVIDADKALAAAKKAEAADDDGDTAAPAEKKKTEPTPDTASLLFEGFGAATDIDVEGKYLYALMNGKGGKQAVVKTPLKGDGSKTEIATGLTGILQLEVDGKWAYLRGESAVWQVPVSGKNEPVQITKGWGGMRDITVHKGKVVIRMGDGRFFTLKKAKKAWQDTLVTEGWKGILQMRNDAGLIYLFSGGQAFRFKIGKKGEQVADNLSADMEGMWVRKGHLYFVSRHGEVFGMKVGKDAPVLRIRPRGSAITDVAVW